MGKSCKEIAEVLVDCIQKTDCVRKGKSVKDCLNELNLKQQPSIDMNQDTSPSETNVSDVGCFGCYLPEICVRNSISNQI